jgi:hypothetical protein
MAAIFLVGSAFAVVCKWIDDNGEIHYSDNPPRDQGVQEVKSPPGPTPEDIERAKERQTRIKKHLEEAAQERDDKQDQCDQARSAVRQLGQPGPGVIHLQTGAKIIATGNKKEELLRYYEQRVKEYCY